MRVDVYSRHDAYVGTIGARQLLGFVWTDCLNGEDTVDITTTFPLKEGYRLVWQDAKNEQETAAGMVFFPAASESREFHLRSYHIQ